MFSLSSADEFVVILLKNIAIDNFAIEGVIHTSGLIEMK